MAEPAPRTRDGHGGAAAYGDAAMASPASDENDTQRTRGELRTVMRGVVVYQ